MYTLALRARSACGRKGLSTTVEEMAGEGEYLDGLSPYACVASGDDHDLAGEVGDV